MKASETFGRQKLRGCGASRRPFNVGLLIPTSGALGLLGPAAYACARLARDAVGLLTDRELDDEIRLNIKKIVLGHDFAHGVE